MQQIIKYFQENPTFTTTLIISLVICAIVIGGIIFCYKKAPQFIKKQEKDQSQDGDRADE